MKYYLFFFIFLSLSAPISFADGQPGKFDFYVLALSWSPDFCATKKDNNPECSIGKKLGFVLHGLWPQYTKGFPADCSHEKLTTDVKAQFPNLYPSEFLYDHEWEKHGTCSGLKPADYLAFSKKLKESVVIPSNYQSPEKPFRTTSAKLKNDFAKANPTFSANSIANYCSGSGRFLKEVFFCYSVKGQPIDCSSEVLNQSAKSCGQSDFLVRNVK